MPRVSAAEARIVVGSSLPVSLKPACEPSAPGSAVCTLTLPVAGQGVWRITLEVAAKGVVGYRLQTARDARWSPVAEGTWQPSGDRVRRSVDLSQATVAGSVLRLALHAVGSQPQLLSATADLVVQTVLFRAEEAGVYSLAYGGVLKPEPKKAEAPAGVAATWLAPGPERERALPVLPAIATAPVVRPREGKFSTAWRIAAPAARPGGLVRLELPSLVYAQARADLGNLRVMSGDRQIPFQVWSPEEPAAALADRDLRLQGSGGRRSGDSSVEIHLPEPGLPLSQIALTAPSVPLRRAVALRYLEPSTTPAREIRRRGRPTLVQGTWECRPQPPLPCRDLLPLPGRAPSVVEVSFHDGDNPPLAGLGAELWRRRDVLLFVWPETETPVRLVAGPDTLTRPLLRSAGPRRRPADLPLATRRDQPGARRGAAPALVEPLDAADDPARRRRRSAADAAADPHGGVSHRRGTKRLLLAGAGHAHLEVLRRLILEPLPEVELTVVSLGSLHHYSGMVPGYLQGIYREEEIAVRVPDLVRRAGGSFVAGKAVGVDPGERRVRVETEEGIREIPYDLVSFAVGSNTAGIDAPRVAGRRSGSSRWSGSTPSASACSTSPVVPETSRWRWSAAARRGSRSPSPRRRCWRRGARRTGSRSWTPARRSWPAIGAASGSGPAPSWRGGGSTSAPACGSPRSTRGRWRRRRGSGSPRG